MSQAPVDFWFSIGSTYTYLSVMRLAAVERAAGVSFRWRPFNVRAVMIEMNNIPFAGKPSKLAYMWRDLARRAQLRGLDYAGPPPYPLKDLARANRVALVAMREDWGADYVRAAYRRWFLEGKDASADDNVQASLAEVGQDAARIIAGADADETVAALAAETETAKSLGVFGSPTFAVGGELFWGDDRLEDAVEWQRHGRLAPAR
jgi:2-hydroxychromene-2-carboxylate isomerase